MILGYAGYNAMCPPAAKLYSEVMLNKTLIIAEETAKLVRDVLFLNSMFLEEGLLYPIWLILNVSKRS